MEIPGRRCVVMSSVAETPRIGQEGARAARPALGRRPLHMVTASLIVPMIAAALVILHARVTVQAPRPFAGVKEYYLGLGDSLAFGFQPNFDFTHGYVYQWYAE